MTEPNKNFTFRGSPSSDQDFYMMAVLKKDSITAFKNSCINSGDFNYLLGENTSDKFFFLCHNQYYNKDLDKHYHRLYWSADPDDFQENFTFGYENQGVAKMNIRTTAGTYNFRYRSSLNGHSVPSIHGKYYNLGYNIGSLTGSEESFPIIFNQKSDTNINQLSLSYSIPYSLENANTYFSNIPNSSYNSIEWVFRKYTEVPEDISIANPDTVNNKENIFNFVQLPDLKTPDGTSTSKFNYGSVKYFKIPFIYKSYDSGNKKIKIKIQVETDVKDFIKNFPLSNGIIKITNEDSSKKTVIRYENILSVGRSEEGKSEFEIFMGKTSQNLIGEDTLEEVFDGGDEPTIHLIFNERNSEDCFTTLIPSATFSKWFDIYLIPMEKDAYFAGGINILDRVAFSTSCTDNFGENGLTPLDNNKIKFYSHESSLPDSKNKPNQYYTCTDEGEVKKYNHYKELKYKKLYNQFMFLLTGALNPKYWNLSSDLTLSTGHDSFPNIAKESPLTFFTWDNFGNAKEGFMFDYCQGDHTCGFCFGRNEKGEDFCITDNLTRKHAALASSSNVKVPLSSTERPNGTHINPGNQFPIYAIVLIVVFSVAILLLIFFVKRYSKR